MAGTTLAIIGRIRAFGKWSRKPGREGTSTVFYGNIGQRAAVIGTVKKLLPALGVALLLFAGCASEQPRPPVAAGKVELMDAEKVVKTDEEWKKQLAPEQYHVLREKGTERPFTGKYNDHKEKGVYSCAGCGQELFESDTKFNSHCGWPSFWDAMDKSKVAYHEDFSHGMHRVEVTCSRCGGHLGHIFDDGPKPTGKRFCINSASLTFKPPSSE